MLTALATFAPLIQYSNCASVASLAASWRAGPRAGAALVPPVASGSLAAMNTGLSEPTSTFCNAAALVKATLGARSVVTLEWKELTGETLVCPNLSVAVTIIVRILSRPGIW